MVSQISLGFGMVETKPVDLALTGSDFTCDMSNLSGRNALIAGAVILAGYKCREAFNNWRQISQMRDFLKQDNVSFWAGLVPDALRPAPNVYLNKAIEEAKAKFYWFKWRAQKFKAPHDILVIDGLLDLINTDIKTDKPKEKAFVFKSYYPTKVIMPGKVTDSDLMEAIEKEKSRLQVNLNTLAPKISDGYDKGSKAGWLLSWVWHKKPEQISSYLIKKIVDQYNALCKHKVESPDFSLAEDLKNLTLGDIDALKSRFLNEYGSVINDAPSVFFDTLIAYARLSAIESNLKSRQSKKTFR